MAELEKELKRGQARFEVFGELRVNEDSWGEVRQSTSSTYKYRRAALSVDLGEGRSTFVELMGGYDPNRPILRRLSKIQGEGLMDIPWANRLNENIVANVSPQSLIAVGKLDENGNIARKVFVSELDAIEEMEKTFKNGDSVHIWGDVEYHRYNGQIQRRLSIRGISQIVPDSSSAGRHEATLRQSFLFSKNSISPDYEDELEEKGKTTITVHVPQYVGKEEGVEVRKVLPFPQTLVYKANNEDEIKRAKFVIEKFMTVEDDDLVREVVLVVDMYDGVETSTGDFELTDDLKDLLDLGVVTEDELKRTSTVSGKRIRENIVLKPYVYKDPRTQQITVMSKDRYDISVLDTSVKEEEPEEASIADMFGESDVDTPSESELDELDLF